MVAFAGCGQDVSLEASQAGAVPSFDENSSFAMLDGKRGAVVQTASSRARELTFAGIAAPGGAVTPIEGLPHLYRSGVVATNSRFAFYDGVCVDGERPEAVEEPCEEVSATVVWVSAEGAVESVVKGPTVEFSDLGEASAGKEDVVYLTDNVITRQNQADRYQLVDQSSFKPLPVPDGTQAACGTRSGETVAAVTSRPDPDQGEGATRVTESPPVSMWFSVLKSGEWHPIGEAFSVSDTSGDSVVSACVIGGLQTDRSVVTSGKEVVPTKSIRADGAEITGILNDNALVIGTPAGPVMETAGGDRRELGPADALQAEPAWDGKSIGLLTPNGIESEEIGA